ncbi:MAG: DUF1598 domain-containing protein [Pirellulales bacterium]
MASALLSGSLLAGEPVAEGADLLAEQLAAGEFAPAFELAGNLEQPRERDQWFESIALAQARSGAAGASFATVAEIRDDLVRSRAIEGVTGSDQPVRGGTGGGGTGQPAGARGGAVEPDFDSLIELITSTIAPTSWDDVGGPGAIQEFEGGVRVDALGLMRPVVRTEGGNELSSLRQRARIAGANGQVRQPSPLRKVSLPRLEREVQLRLASGSPLDEEMMVMAGLQRIQYILVYPESGDIVLAGPAGDWTRDRENRLVSAETGRPLVRLEDLVLLLRHYEGSPDGLFGCSIDPTREGLANAQSFLDQSSAALKPGQAKQWVSKLRDALGPQNVKVFGIDAASRVARILVEADYHMKLVGLGLEEGTLDVPSYLDLVQVPAGRQPPPLGVLRLWFTLNYQALRGSPQRDVFEVRGQGVKVLSENELLTAEGKRVATGKSDELAQEFAHRFTKHFAALAAKYPVYAELQNVFDLALVSALLKSEGLSDRAGWRMLCFGDADQFVVAAARPSRTVDSVVNHRVVNKKHILAAVSGGVRVDASSIVEPGGVEVDRLGKLDSERSRSRPAGTPRTAWWWD